MRDKVTKRAVDALKPGPDGKEAVIWDTEVKGFGVRVQRGGTKSYIVHYRVGTGRGAPIRKVTIGQHGSPWTPETARREAKRMLGRGESDDPADRLARRKSANNG
jgi:Arm DNA-binding domain